MKTLILAAIRCSLLLLVPTVTYAISAQWDLDPISGDWNTADNWTPNVVPNAPADVAIFELSHNTDVSISADTEVNSIIFGSAATNDYTITVNLGLTLTISGSGIINNSGIAQNFVTKGGSFPFGGISFTNHATAGGSTTFTNNHSLNNFAAGHTLFFDTATAGDATFINKSGTVSGGMFQGFTQFSDTATAGNGSFVNQGGTTSNVINGGRTSFNDTSTAGEATITNDGALASNAGFGETVFFNNSTAGSATIINNGGTVTGARGGNTEFFAFSGSPTAGSATIINNGGMVSGADGGLTLFTSFTGTPTAGSATIINNGATVSGAAGGSTVFNGTSTGASATLIANAGSNGGGGGTIVFEDQSTAGTARIQVFGNGSLDISLHDAPGMTINAIEGDGNVFLGANNLTVGSDNLSTTFAGAIQDGGEAGGVGGSLSKIGTGTLVLSGLNTYTGDTNIRGVLQVDGSITSNTFVRGTGTLAGTGTINAGVSNLRGRVSPGGALAAPGTLTVVEDFTQTQFAALMIQIAGTSDGQFSVLNVLGNASLRGFLDPVLVNGFVPSIGDSFVFLNAGSLSGQFDQIRPLLFDHGTLQWSVTYDPNHAILTVGPNTIPDGGSTFLLLTLGILGLLTHWRYLLRGCS
jgi:autotransporter-associated beta strand protein